ncbi:MAG: hypothetical protein COA43_02770 [Robiginitomaculum sp.]|nr:MAG: hypothetical protein COA43_02770 [Robiginitomaculum sp.]
MSDQDNTYTQHDNVIGLSDIQQIEAKKILQEHHTLQEMDLLGLLRQIQSAKKRKLLLQTAKYMAWREMMDIEQKVDVEHKVDIEHKNEGTQK